MKADRWAYIILRVICSIALALFCTWLFDAPRSVAVILYFIVYTSLLVSSIARELNARLKVLGAYLEDDAELDEDDAPI